MSWDTIKLGELCNIEKGVTGIQKAIPGQYPMVVTSEERKSHNEYQFDDEAVLIPLVSSTGHGHRSLKRIHYQTGKFALGSILCAVIPKNKKQLNAEYLYRYLDLNKENELVLRMKGMANVTLPIKEIADIDIPVPPLSEQLRFIKKHELTETHSEGLKQELFNQTNLLTKLRQSFLQEAMQGKLVKQDLNDGHAKDLLEKIKAENAKSGRKEKELPPIKPGEIPFEIPENWVWCRLGDVISYAENLDIHKKLSPQTLINYVDINSIDNKKYIIGDVKQKKVSELSTRARRVLKKGYLIYSTVRPYLKNIAIVKDELPNYIGSTGFNVFRAVEANLNFIFYFLLSPNVNENYKGMMVGFNSPSITNEQFEKTLFPLPPISEQIRIVKKISELMKFCDELEQSIQKCQEQNELLLQQVLKEALNR